MPFPAITYYMISKKHVLLSLIILFITAGSAQSGFVPYGRIFKATQDERTYITQAQDTRLQIKLHKALALNAPASILYISSYVYLGHGFIIGEVSDETERTNLIESAQSVSGLNAIGYYLPVKLQTQSDEPSALEIKLKGIFEPDYPSSKLTVKVVQDHIVLLGVLDKNDQEIVLNSVEKIAGSNKIINFLQSPQPENRKNRRIRPLRNLFN